MPRYHNKRLEKAYERALIADMKARYGAEGFQTIIHDRNGRATIIASACQLAALERRALRYTGQEGGR